MCAALFFCLRRSVFSGQQKTRHTGGFLNEARIAYFSFVSL